MSKRFKVIFLLALLGFFGVEFLMSSSVFAASTADAAAAGESGHHSHALPALLSLVIILLAAKIGGDIAVRVGQPVVLGELIIGVIIGNLALVGFNGLGFLTQDNVVEVLSELGVVLLLFEVGLETSVKQMAQVGKSSLFVAILGVIVPFFLGWGVGAWFMPEAGTLVHVFLGATLTATSVGITARVLKDIGKVDLKESRIVLGAAVIDDVLGLLILAVVSGLIASANSGEAFEYLSLAGIVLKAIGFFALSLAIGKFILPVSFKAASYLKSHDVLLAVSLIICFGMAYISALLGLAAIVGAFTAGLILEPVQYKDLATRNNNVEIDELIKPLTSVFVPIFFILMGAKVNLSVFGDLSLLGFALALTVAAIIGKQICGFGVTEKGVDKAAVGLGMIPRGEVGLIFIGIGASLKVLGEPVVDAATYGAVVIMVIVTTMLTPPLIKWRFAKLKQKTIL